MELFALNAQEVKFYYIRHAKFENFETIAKPQQLFFFYTKNMYLYEISLQISIISP